MYRGGPAATGECMRGGLRSRSLPAGANCALECFLTDGALTTPGKGGRVVSVWGQRSYGVFETRSMARLVCGCLDGVEVNTVLPEVIGPIPSPGCLYFGQE